MSNYYQVLGIPPTASEDEVKRSFKKLAVKYHPDKTDNKDHHQLFIKINEAYETLKSPDSRKKYNSKNGFDPKPDYTYTASTTFTTSRTSFTRGGAGVYYEYYRRHEKEAEDLARETARQRQEAQEALNAKFAREKEELERRRKEEAQRRLYKWKEEQMKQQQAKEREAELARERRREEEEEAKRFREEMEHRQRQEQFLRSQNEVKTERIDENDMENDQYDDDIVEFEARFINREDDRQDEALSEAGDLNNPIVVEDEDDTPSTLSKDSSNLSYASATETADPETELEQEQEPESGSGSSKTTYLNMANLEKLFSEGLNSNFKAQKSRRSASPTRPKFQTPLKKPASNVRLQSSPVPVPNSSKTVPNSSKKMKVGTSGPKSPEKKYDYTEFEEALGTNIDNVDLSDIYDSLPNSTRKISENITNAKKKPRLSEYSNGRTKADTLHIPVNKTMFSGHPSPSKPKTRAISVLDLHASPAIHGYVAPTPPSPPEVARLTSQAWKQYVGAINVYEKRFLDYKKHIIQYQFERYKKDEEFYDVINNDPGNFEVYQACLSRDFEVLEEYHNALRDFITTMQNYKQNCSWMQMAQL